MGLNYLMPKKYKISSLKKNKFSLILSGGASLGLAHIGVINFLEEHKLTPSEIICTSMGSIIGALYAIGNTSETIKEKLKNLKTNNLFEIKYFQGRVEYKKAKVLLKEMFQNRKMSDTTIPLKIIATNIKNGNKKIFTSSDDISIYDAVMASSTIPGVLTAKRIKHEVFIDGGVSSNLPIEVAKENNIKLAINVINKKIKNYHYHNPKKGLINNLITKFTILRSVTRYYIENQTEIKIPTTSKLILIEPNLKRFNSYKLINYKKIAHAGYLEIKKYFDEAEKTKPRKRKKKKTILGEIIKLTKDPIKETKKLIK